MGNINSSPVAKAPVGSTIKSARIENESPHAVKARADSANESAKTEIKRSHSPTIGSEANGASTAPLGSASKPVGTATKSPSRKKSFPRLKDPGVGTCGG